MAGSKKPLSPHVRAYGIALLLVGVGTALVLLAYNVAAGFVAENLERVSWGVIMLVGLPLIIAGQVLSDYFERRWGLVPETLEAIGLAFLFANLLVLSSAGEEGLSTVRPHVYMRDVAIAFAALWVFYQLWLRVTARVSNWWARRKDKQDPL